MDTEFHQVTPITQLPVNELVKVCHRASANAGWWDEYHAMPVQYRKYFLASRIALIHSETSETLEAMRKNKDDNHLPHRKGVEVELADAVIRIFDMAGALELDLAGAIAEKLAYNAQRADHTREARAAEGGKSL